MFSASGRFVGVYRQPLKGVGAAGVYQEEEGRYVPGQLRRRDEPAGEGFFRRKEVAVFLLRPAPGGGQGWPEEGGLRRSGGCSFQVRRRSVRLSTLPRSVAGRGSEEAMRLPR